MASAQTLHLFGELPDVETTVRCSQFVQAEGLRYANQSMRRHQWHRSACTFWTYTFGVVSQEISDASAAWRVPAVAPDGRRNLALVPGAKAGASSLIPGYAIHQVAHLNDGWYGNEASWIEGERPSWAQIDLGAMHTISRVCVGNDHTRRFSDRGATEFRILAARVYAADSRAPAWQTIATFKGEPLQGTKAYDFEPVRARWIRIDVTTGSGTRIDEIEVYEAVPVPARQVAAAEAAAVRGPMPVTPEQAVPRGCLRPLLTAPATELELSIGPGTEPERSGSFGRRYRARVRNRGTVPALFVKLDTEAVDTRQCEIAENWFTLLAGEARAVDVWLSGESQTEGRAGPMHLRARAWNSRIVSEPLESR